MSGGVDSSVAACLLKDEGYEVVGVTMKLWNDEQAEAQRTSQSRGCCTLDDVEDARRVCQIIGAPHYVMNFQQEFQAHVIDYFCSEYLRGRTPHPCLACNDKIKFDFLMKKAAALDIDYVATGHYARLDASAGAPKLLKGIDATKDQSYVLFNLRPLQAARLPPPGGLALKKGHTGGRPRGGSASGGQAGQPGDMLHTPERLPGVPHSEVQSNPWGHSRQIRRCPGASQWHSGLHRWTAARLGNPQREAHVRAGHRCGVQSGCSGPARGPDAEQPVGLRRQLPFGRCTPRPDGG